jgi:hypothetical protein
MSLSSLPPSTASINALAKGPNLPAPSSADNKSSSTPAALLEAKSTPQSRQVTLLSSASYTVSLNNNVSSYTYSNTNERSQQFNSNGVLINASIAKSVGVESSQASVSASVNDIEKVAAPKTLLDGSKNILKFIEQRLAAEQASGASNEELEKLLGQGLSGFKQGFSEAEAILGNASEVVSAAINQLYSEVIDGFEALTKQYLTNDSAQIDAESSSDQSLDVPAVISSEQIDRQDNSNDSLNQVTPTVVNKNASDIFGANRLSSLSDIIDSINDIDAIKVAQEDNKGFLNLDDKVTASIDYRKQNIFNFEMLTADGDKVSIQASSAGAYSNNFAYDQRSDQVNPLQMERTSLNAAFEFNVDGELDDEEVIAIQNLLDDVLKLSDEFYNGDVSKAFEKALALDFNQQEITGFAVDLRQTEQFSVAAAYKNTPASLSPSSFQETSSELSPFNAELGETFSIIGDFVSRVYESLNKNSNNNINIFDAQELFLKMAEQLDEQNDQVNKEGQGVFFSDSIHSLLN